MRNIGKYLAITAGALVLGLAGRASAQVTGPNSTIDSGTNGTAAAEATIFASVEVNAVVDIWDVGDYYCSGADYVNDTSCPSANETPGFVDFDVAGSWTVTVTDDEVGGSPTECQTLTSTTDRVTLRFDTDHFCMEITTSNDDANVGTGDHREIFTSNSFDGFDQDDAPGTYEGTFNVTISAT